MRLRTIALALALACGSTVMANANPAKRVVVHKSARKSTVRRSKLAKTRRAKRIKIAHHKTNA